MLCCICLITSLILYFLVKIQIHISHISLRSSIYKIIFSNIKSEKVERRMQKSLPMGEKSVYSLAEEEISSSIE